MLRRDFIPTFINLKIRGQLITVEMVMISCPPLILAVAFKPSNLPFPFLHHFNAGFPQTLSPERLPIPKRY